MWINLTKDIFDNSDLKGLNYLYQILSYNPSTSTFPRYNIVVDTDKVKGTSNFKTLNVIEKSLVEFLDIEYSNFTTTAQNLSYKISSKRNELHFNVEEAIIFLSQPVSIILENNKNDAEFVLAIIKHFGVNDGYNKLDEHINNSWLKFENAGGCDNLPNFIEGFLKQFKNISTKNNKNRAEYFRGFIILDSDIEYPNQTPKHTEVLRKLNELGVESNQICILEKRMMENYLPEKVFEELKENNQNTFSEDLINWIDAYLSLTDKQKDYINIPKGNLLGNENPKAKGLTDFWEVSETNISQVNSDKLNIGFKFNGFHGNGSIRQANNFKNAFPRLFIKATHRGLLDRTRHQDNPNELKDILDKITALL
jgi:hypothetical protein